MFLSLFKLININKPIQNIVCDRRAVQFNMHLSTKKYMKSLTFGKKFCLMCPSSVCQKQTYFSHFGRYIAAPCVS